jgi:hypothetical protein
MSEVSAAEISRIVTRDDDRVFLIANAGRVAAAAFFAAIEWYWYAPKTPRNRFYDCYVTEWTDLRWMVVAFPQGRLPAARRLAKQLGLRIADGVPTQLEKRNNALVPTFFPGATLPNGRDNLSMFAVENDKGSPVYRNVRRDHEAMLQATGEIVGILNRGASLTPAEIADYIYGPGFPATAP